jgi:hypothetical protein
VRRKVGYLTSLISKVGKTILFAAENGVGARPVLIDYLLFLSQFMTMLPTIKIFGLG